ncbi:hypothetical protein APSETT444_009766 [Aspergillus pseudonomiae]
MEQLSRALLGVKGCMVPFRGAVGTILEQLKDEEKTVEAANTRIDMMTACTRLYVVLVVMKAGNFFDKGSRQYDEYRLLMREIFELDIDEEANLSRYIKTTGQQICCHVKYVQGKVKIEG